MWSWNGSTRNPPGIHLESSRNLVGLGSGWIRVNLVGMVGIWWEFGGNHSQSEWNLGGFSLTFHSYQIPTIPTIPPGFHSNSTWFRVECPGQGKVLYKLPSIPGQLLVDMFMTRKEEVWMGVEEERTLGYRAEEVFTLLHWFLGNSRNKIWQGNQPNFISIPAEFRWNLNSVGMVPGILGTDWGWEFWEQNP